ncbi:MAG TPA: DUF5674 family protein [Pyrinomonadaceae bacterium]|jgi:hypothetical protein|nr:DUF5674 family protein [Pyrinomonadaceae bacterium]
MGIILVSEPISLKELRQAGEELFGDMVKAVVDVEQEVIAAGAELHADEEAFLLERNARQENLWGINLYTERVLPEMIEFDSMINIRPRQNNRSRGVEDPKLQSRIVEIVRKLVR